MELLQVAAELGGTVFVVALFIGYLIKRNGKQENAMKEVSDTLREVHNAQETHSRILMRVAENHDLQADADALMRNPRKTT